jgi:hypothetical protein
MIWTPRFWLPERASGAQQRLREHKRRMRRRGMLALPCCCGGALVIAVLNTNAIVDDNHDVKLNGTLLGTNDNSLSRIRDDGLFPPCGLDGLFAADGNKCTGRIFAQDTAITSWVGFPSCAGTGGYNLESTLSLNTALFINGTNTLRIESVTDPSCGNEGSVRVVLLSAGGATNRTVTTTYLSTEYGYFSVSDGGPGFQEFTFTYP